MAGEQPQATPVWVLYGLVQILFMDKVGQRNQDVLGALSAEGARELHDRV